MKVKKLGPAEVQKYWITCFGKFFFPRDQQVDLKTQVLDYTGRPLELRPDESHVFVHCLLNGTVYKFDRPGYSDEEILLMIKDLELKEQKKLNRLKENQEEPLLDLKFKRGRISEEVRTIVWRRDEGKCVRCGSRDKLEFDHILPVSRGGSNTTRNVELLCECCNREKGSKIQ